MSFKKNILPILGFLGLGGLYFIWLELTGIAIPCIFRKITGFQCPGCGITGLAYHVLIGDFKTAYASNPFLFVTSPFLVFEIGFLFFVRCKGKNLPKWNEAILIVYLIALCVFGVLRNI